VFGWPAMKNMRFLIIGMFSLFALGFAAPAGAATLEDVNGELLKPGDVLTMTAATLVSSYPGTSSSTTCENVVLRYEVTKNGPEQVSLLPGTITRGACLLKPGNTPVFLISALLYSPIVLAEGKGTGSFQFKEKISVLTCTYSGVFNFSYETETDVLSVPGSTLAGEGGGCPTSEVVQGDFVLTNKLGQVTIN
jgi:hypothetical protein